jgi:hypothetical protein
MLSLIYAVLAAVACAVAGGLAAHVLDRDGDA